MKKIKFKFIKSKLAFTALLILMISSELKIYSFYDEVPMWLQVAEVFGENQDGDEDETEIAWDIDQRLNRLREGETNKALELLREIIEIYGIQKANYRIQNQEYLEEVVKDKFFVDLDTIAGLLDFIPLSIKVENLKIQRYKLLDFLKIHGLTKIGKLIVNRIIRQREYQKAIEKLKHELITKPLTSTGQTIPYEIVEYIQELSKK